MEQSFLIELEVKRRIQALREADTTLKVVYAFEKVPSFGEDVSLERIWSDSPVSPQLLMDAIARLAQARGARSLVTAFSVANVDL